VSATSAPLKYLAGINERALPETTEPDHWFRYIDISSVGRGELVAEPEEMRFEDAPSRARRLVRAGDTIVSTVRTYLRAVWPVSGPADDLVASTGFAVLSPREIDPHYFSWWVRSDLFIEEVVARSVGVSYPAINALELGALKVRVPRQAEQRAIADFLDTETARIDALITKKRRMIDLLEERFRCWLDERLHCSQSAGLDKSGSWPWVPLRRVASVHGGLTLGKKFDHGQPYPYLRVANVQDRRLDLAEITTVDVPPDVAARFALRDGDVLMLEGNGNANNLGRGTIWRGEIEGCLHQNHVHVVRVDPRRITPEYLDWVVRTAWARRVFSGTSAQVSIATLSQQQILDLVIPLPPTALQAQIVTEVEAAHHRMLALTTALNRQASLLREHRQALITDAVTGELDIPVVAA
jgi:type I restriction enzyme S subunit